MRDGRLRAAADEAPLEVLQVAVRAALETQIDLLVHPMVVGLLVGLVQLRLHVVDLFVVLRDVLRTWKISGLVKLSLAVRLIWKVGAT